MMQRILLAGFAVGGLCEATPWEDGLLDDPGLMQVKKHMLSHVGSPGVTAPPVSHEGLVSLHSMEAMENFVNRVAAGEPTPAEIALVTEMITLMDTTFIVELQSQSDDDQQDHRDKLAAHALCTVTHGRSMGEDGYVTLLKAASVSTRAKHKGCRKAWKSYEIFMADVEAVRTAGLTSWATLAPATDSIRIPELDNLCPHLGHPNLEPDTFLGDVKLYKDMAEVNEVSVSCDTDQSLFEQTWCDWLAAKTSTCLALDACVSQINAEANIALVLTRDTNRRASLRTIWILQCRLQHIADTFNAATGASDFDVEDTCGTTAVTPDAPTQTTAPQGGHYDLNLELPVPHVPCIDDDDIDNPVMPCNSEGASDVAACDCTAWRNKEYNLDGSHIALQTDPVPYWNVAVHKNPTRCFGTCVIPTTVPPIIITDCEDSWIGTAETTDPCPFYRLHPQACGQYPSDGYERCCACGGGTTPPFTPIIVSRKCQPSNTIREFDTSSVQLCYEACLDQETGPFGVTPIPCTHFTFGTTAAKWRQQIYGCQICSNSDTVSISSEETLNFDMYAMPLFVVEKKCPYGTLEESHEDRVFRSDHTSVLDCYHQCLGNADCTHFSYAFLGADISNACIGCRGTEWLKDMPGSPYVSFNMPTNPALPMGV